MSLEVFVLSNSTKKNLLTTFFICSLRVPIKKTISTALYIRNSDIALEELSPSQLTNTTWVARI